MMDTDMARAFARLQAEMRGGPRPPRSVQLAMFEPASKRDAAALAMAAAADGEWTPPRGIGAAARRLLRIGMLVRNKGRYTITLDGRGAARGGATVLECP
jgi:hypothetical protein